VTNRETRTDQARLVTLFRARVRRSLKAAAGAIKHPLAWLLVLDWLLFLPGYLFAQPPASFWPFAPHDRDYRFDLRSLYLYALTLLLRRENLDIFRISIDFVALCALVIWAGSLKTRGAARTVVSLAAALYTLLFLFTSYHNALYFFFARAPALGEDYKLLLNLLHLLSEMKLLAWLLGTALLAVLVASHVLAWNAFRAAQLRAASWSLRRRAGWTLGFAVIAAASLVWFGAKRDDPLLQLVGKRVVYNYQTSIAEAVRLGNLYQGPPDHRYAEFMQIKLQKKPDVYLLMLEAYGEILATWDMNDAYRALMNRVDAQLSAAGYHARSAYSRSPVHGGTSWFSIATVHTGIWIDRQDAYSALQRIGSTVPSLTSFLRVAGYRTHTLQPGTAERTGIRHFDLFRHDEVVDRTMLPYAGHEYGWGRVPDQYSIGFFREHAWAKAARERRPRSLFFMCVSTHWPWGEGVPPYVRDWKTLERARAVPAAADDPSWPAFAEASSIGTELRRSYFRSVEYEFRLLTEWLTSEVGRDSVILIVGDHQPRLESDHPGAITLNTPVHVLSRDAAFVESFAARGFQAGMYADPKLRAPLRHDGLFSLMISELAARYGDADASSHAHYYPDGIPLAGLRP
jgi:hypothetical protein